VSIKLEQVGPTVISTDGKYSEDTTIRVTAVRTGTGETLAGFAGAINIAEDGTTIYSENGMVLQSSVNISSGGTVTFVAKSLAGPKVDGTKPDPALIKTTNYPVYGASNVAIPQWIISTTPIDPRAQGAIYDWVQSRVRDIFASATGNFATVLSAVSTYTIAAGNFGGQTPINRAAQSPIVINPYLTSMRIDGDGGNYCGTTRKNFFTNVVLHEARHAYQGAQSFLSGNDQDGDSLVKTVGVPPTDILVDSTTVRNVCNDTTTGSIESRSYHGDSVVDQWLAPDFVLYALQMDALLFAAN
jgi:hypothetical protein